MQMKPVYKPGDRVIIRDLGEQYPHYDEWFEQNNIPVKIAARYQYGHNMEDSGWEEGDSVTVVAVGTHGIDAGETLLAVDDNRWHDQVWLIGASGVEPEIKIYNVRISFPKRFRAKSFEEANNIAREYLSNATGIAKDDIEVCEE